MFNRALSAGRVTLALLCLAVLIGLFFWTRCTQTDASRPVAATGFSKAEVAHLTMQNGSPCEWQIVFKPAVGGDPQSWKLALDQSLAVDLASGDYAVEQTMLMDDAGPDATRRFLLHLDAGETYRWRLITLLSGAAEDVRLPAPENQRP